jgi:hypothetical protein
MDASTYANAQFSGVPFEAAVTGEVKALQASIEVSDDDDTASRTSEEDDYAIVFDSIEESLGDVALALSSESFGQPGELKEAIDALAAVRRGN